MTKETCLSLALRHLTLFAHTIVRKAGIYFRGASPESIYIQICHSQGAVNVRNALLAYPCELCRRVAVIAVAPGAYIIPGTCLSVSHLRASSCLRDPIPRIDREGMRVAHDTIIDLPSHPDAPLHDHPFTSPTYRRRLEDEINKVVGERGGGV